MGPLHQVLLIPIIINNNIIAFKVIVTGGGELLMSIPCQVNFTLTYLKHT